jgi:NAD(P)H-hydrate epimerase
VAVLAGRGNNGGDGFVLARHLAWWGLGEVRVYLAGKSAEVFDDARVNLEYLAAPGVAVTELAAPVPPADWSRVAEADWLVDALLGTGLTGRVRGVAAELINLARGCGRPVLAVDTPSGLDATDGTSHGALLPATVTVTFGVPKQGFFRGEGPAAVGQLVVAEISLPRRITGARVIVE